MQIEKIDFYGMSAIHFEAGGYEAIMIPEIGANVVKLSHKASGTNILRTPAEDEIVCRAPVISRALRLVS